MTQVFTLFVCDVLHGQSFQVEDDRCLYYRIWYALVLLRVRHHSPNAGFNKINDVHDEISFFGRTQNAFHVRLSVSSNPHCGIKKKKKIFSQILKLRNNKTTRSLMYKGFAFYPVQRDLRKSNFSTLPVF